ncbi:MAG: T9SS type A sorting domain-containing protein [Lewinella sp.]
MPRLIISLLTVVVASCLMAQTIELTPTYPVVEVEGRPLPLAWFGGLNTPQTQAEDLDGDGIDDLYFFDKAGEIHLAMRGDGNGNYEEAPELTKHFPDSTSGWIMLRDFDVDGTPDMFTYAEGVDGVRVLGGHRRTDGLLEFSLIEFAGPLPLLSFPFEGNRPFIFVTGIDYPAVEDFDFDGDLDLITFSVNGGYVEYYKNQSVERGFGTDTLIYTLESQCWGGFFESGITTKLDLAPGPDDCFDNLVAPSGGGRPRHSGSSITAFDYDGNGLLDVMLGDVSFDRLTLGLNNGSVSRAWISAQDSVWNQNGTIVDIASFPVAFHVDIDQDGARDIIASPSVVLNGSDVGVMWYYRNEGTDAAPSFVFQDDRKLVRDMIDLGTSASVTVFDYDADGRPDLVLGNNDEYTPDNSLDSRLRLLRNVTPNGGDIAFELVDEDYLGMSAFQTTGWAFAPTFGDLDDDGDLDVVIGNRDGKLFYGENTAGPGNTATFAQLVFAWQGLDAGQFSKPFLSDLDRDGKTDLLVGGFDGRIRFYHNVGTATAPAFNEEVTAAGNMIQLGGINTNAPGVSTGHPNPWVIQNPNYTLVLSGNRTGNIQAYRFGVDSAHTEPFTLLNKKVDDLDVGGFSNPGFGDFDGDGKLEVVVGNQRGGVTFFRSNLNEDATTGLFAAARPDFDFAISPNPIDELLTISGWPRGAVRELALLDVNGRVLRTEQVQQARTQVQWKLEGLSAGVYVVRASGVGGVATRKVVVR